jgi:SlyX protein
MKKRQLDERLVELETKSAFQEDTLNQLDQEVIRQQREIERLARQVELLLEEVRHGVDGALPEGEPPPPHY